MFEVPAAPVSFAVPEIETEPVTSVPEEGLLISIVGAVLSTLNEDAPFPERPALSYGVTATEICPVPNPDKSMKSVVHAAAVESVVAVNEPLTAYSSSDNVTSPIVSAVASRLSTFPLSFLNTTVIPATPLASLAVK